jgi:hypothetical protein
MAASLKQHLGAISDKSDAKELRKLLEAVLADNTALRASFLLLTAKIDVLAVKLNADGGVTDTNYAVNFASTTNPAALSLTA